MKYTVRPPSSDYSDWASTTFNTTISKVLVLSYRGATLLDTWKTDNYGVFEIYVPATSDPTDRIVFLAASPDSTGRFEYVVADPGFGSTGTQPIGTLGVSPRIWSWSIATSSVTEGSTITIGEASGAGALRVYDYARYVYDTAGSLRGQKGLSFVVWLGYGTSWSCGACFAQSPTVFTNAVYQSQLWMPGSLTDERWWSDAVTAHELGHWLMASYGTSPDEGGRHVLGAPTMPGMAWSEGWATWHSSAMRGNSIFFDKQQGAMFWLDLANDRYSTGQAWQLPSPSAGLLQNLDENEVASMLWTIFNQPGVTTAAFCDALASPRMNTSPWARGYTRHFWADLDSRGRPLNPIDTGISRPALPDFLDALVCGGVSAGAIDLGTIPATQYPYPSAAPICQ